MPNTKHEPKRQVSPKELAEYFSVSTRTVTNWKAAGIIPFIRIGRVVRFSIDEVEAALEKYKVKVWDRTGKEVR
ncbi:helix-turn-helix domain-containing protein [Akkermansiaceae bacterium]|nr:helix-turn-helix domain-containing protein [Akkermansiaceae bacterium]MDB4406734.1 helix-turn-helix domain-containing protein [Akkermansiaceae bacterium]